MLDTTMSQAGFERAVACLGLEQLFAWFSCEHLPLSSVVSMSAPRPLCLSPTTVLSTVSYDCLGEGEGAAKGLARH